MSGTKRYKLMYFDLMALAEPIRFLFHYGNIEFEDYRYTKEEWFGSIKQTAPFLQGPLLEVDGQEDKRLFQSVAIQRYVAKLVGLFGADEHESFDIDMTAETIWDFRCLLYKWNFGKPEVKEQNRHQVLEVDVPYMLERLEKQVEENNGYFVNGKVSWPDLQYTAYYDYFCKMAGRDLDLDYQNLRGLRKKVLEIPQIEKWVKIRPKSDL